jgi:hypothetical protein
MKTTLNTPVETGADVAYYSPLVSGLHARYLKHDTGSAYQHALSRAMAVQLNLDTVMQTGTPGPDIEWNPSYQTYLERVAALAKCNLNRPQTLPIGYPQCVQERWAWTGADIRTEQYVIKLSERDVREVESALLFFQSKFQWPFKGCSSSPSDLNLGPQSVCQDNFPLPNLRVILEGIAKELHDGIGFAVIRGLEPAKYTALENVIVYLGVTSYVAETRGCQNSSGNMISE